MSCPPQALKELRAFGIYDMGTPPMRCMVYRSSYARDLFTQPCLLGAALQCLKGKAGVRPSEQRLVPCRV